MPTQIDKEPTYLLDVDQAFTEWDNETEVVQREDGKVKTDKQGNPLSYRLKDAVVQLANACPMMGCTEVEKSCMFRIARSVGRAEGEVQLLEHELELLKKLTDKNKVEMRLQSGNKEELDQFGLLVQGQLKAMLKAAVKVEATANRLEEVTTNHKDAAVP